jgi:CBS domain containing-hemolysin-like protein
VLHALAGLVTVLIALARPGVAVGRAVWPGSGRTELEEREDAAEDLRDMVDLVSENEQIEDDERTMLHSVFELGRTLTREVMVPRTDMITLLLDTSLDRAIGLFIRSGFSRIPVIADGVDDMRGMLYLKDALRATRRNGDTALTAADVMRPVRFVPEMKLVDDLLREMQAESSHIAVVVDEYGGVAGLVTIEDLLEELVGELQDEHDADLPAVEDVGDGVLRIPARMAVDDLGDLFDLEIDDDDVDTAGGLLAKALGKVPIEGAEADILGLHLVAERADGRRRQISTMLVSRTENEDES